MKKWMLLKLFLIITISVSGAWAGDWIECITHPSTPESGAIKLTASGSIFLRKGQFSLYQGGAAEPALGPIDLASAHVNFSTREARYQGPEGRVEAKLIGNPLRPYNHLPQLKLSLDLAEVGIQVNGVELYCVATISGWEVME